MERSGVKNILVLYHAACLDGFGAAFAAWCKFGSNAEYIPVTYGDEPPDVTNKDVYILDFSYPREVLLRMRSKARCLLVLDHHKTTQEALTGLDFARFDMTKSGCVLSWEYFHPGRFTPMLLQHIQDRDLWAWKLDDTKAICKALYETVDWTFEAWGQITVDEHLRIPELQSKGALLVQAEDRTLDAMEAVSFRLSIGGELGIGCNAPPAMASELGNRLALKSGTFAAIFCFDGTRGEWKYSLRSIGDYDVTALAKAFGGGGHKNAAGFSTRCISHILVAEPQGSR